MIPPCASSIIHISYWEFFQNYYTPLLKEVDVLLKTIEEPITTTKAAKVLNLKTYVVDKIMLKENIPQIDQQGLLRIMMHGKSSLCRLLQRECMCGSPNKYTPADISYIYNLQQDHVKKVCKELGYDYISTKELPNVLSKIYIYIMQ